MDAKLKKEKYQNLLSKEGALSLDAINRLLDLFKQHNMMIDENLPKDLTRKGKFGQKITGLLTNLKLYAVKGNPSWEGLVVGFPGSKEQFSKEYVGTPYIREILYPILDLYERLRAKEKARMPCLYLLGSRFNDVFLRKFRLLQQVIPHVIILSEDLLERAVQPLKESERINEEWIHNYLYKKMREQGELSIPTNAEPIKVGFLANEFNCFEGTVDPERLDILCYDKKEHSLVAFEIKGPTNRVQLENLFLQGMEHRNWLEENKMAVKFIFEGPNGKKINTKKRVRLILGFCGDEIPELFNRLRTQAKKDQYLQIDYCRFVIPSDVFGELDITHF